MFSLSKGVELLLLIKKWRIVLLNNVLLVTITIASVSNYINSLSRRFVRLIHLDI